MRVGRSGASIRLGLVRLGKVLLSPIYARRYSDQGIEWNTICRS